MKRSLTTAAVAIIFAFAMATAGLAQSLVPLTAPILAANGINLMADDTNSLDFTASQSNTTIAGSGPIVVSDSVNLMVSNNTPMLYK